MKWKKQNMGFTLTIEKLIHGGMGLGFCEGKPIFVPFSAPGDILEVELSGDFGSYAEAKIQRIVTPSTLRVDPPCPYFTQCGGCQWQHLASDAQLVWKRNLVLEAFTRIAGLPEAEISPLVADCLPSSKPFHYRNRIQLKKSEAGDIGFFQARTHKVVPIEACLIADERINTALAKRREEFLRLPVAQFELQAQAQGQAVLKGELAENYDFSQVNDGQNAVLKALLLDEVKQMGEVQHVLELYAGAGNFSFPLAALARQVTACDADKKAISYAKMKQNEQKIENISFFSLTSKEMMQKFKKKADFIVLDPPRKGASEVIRAIAQCAAEKIVYISCNPSTLARDAKALMKCGYKLEKIIPLDMFPQTYHVETFSVFAPT